MHFMIKLNFQNKINLMIDQFQKSILLFKILISSKIKLLWHKSIKRKVKGLGVLIILILLDKMLFKLYLKRI